MKIGETISELRKDRGLKQKQVAAVLNVATSTISNYETDTHEPDLKKLCVMADMYHVSTDYILGRTKSRSHPEDGSEKIHGIISEEKVIHMLEHITTDDFRCIMRVLYIAYKYRERERERKEI